MPDAPGGIPPATIDEEVQFSPLMRAAYVSALSQINTLRVEVARLTQALDTSRVTVVSRPSGEAETASRVQAEQETESLTLALREAQDEIKHHIGLIAALQAALDGLEQQYREEARMVRPPENAPITAHQRQRIRDWMLYTQFAIRLAALRTPETDT